VTKFSYAQSAAQCDYLFDLQIIVAGSMPRLPFSSNTSYTTAELLSFPDGRMLLTRPGIQSRP
jgi:hypothetical protein